MLKFPDGKLTDFNNDIWSCVSFSLEPVGSPYAQAIATCELIDATGRSCAVLMLV